MYKISVPVMNETFTRNREETLKLLKRIGAERVFISTVFYIEDEAKEDAEVAEMKANKEILEANGYEVGYWHSGTMITEGDYAKSTAADGTVLGRNACVLDPKFIKKAARCTAKLAATGPSLIMYDDDLRYGNMVAEPCCLCQYHLARISEMLGEEVTREQIREHIRNGGKNKYRDAFLQANGDALRNFAKEMRKAVDSVNPDVRLSFCACLSTWDIDGTDGAELARIFAGNTKPFIRLNGAPFWARGGSRGYELQDVVDFERIVSSYTKSDDIEVFAEGDSHPRPRSSTAAAYVEGFDTAIRASGCTDGILKYIIEYDSQPQYEQGYVKYHERNKPLYAQIDKYFGGKSHVGVRVFEAMKKAADMVVPTTTHPTTDMHYLFNSTASKTLAYNTIPATFVGDGICTAIFDENARHCPLDVLKHGAIIDTSAAEILMERGVDVGITKLGKPLGAGTFERFLYNDNVTVCQWGDKVFDIEVSDSVEVLSTAETEGKTIPMSYKYENAKGERFLVFNIDPRILHIRPVQTSLKSYERSLQIASNMEWLCGEKLPAYCYGNPALYMQCKTRGEGDLTVGLWNFFIDPVFDAVIELGKSYKSIEFINCSGRLEGDKVYLDTDIAPFGFAGFEVKE